MQYNQVNPNNNFEYDEDNPIHRAVKKAIQALISNINNANGDCSSIMSMQDFINILNNLLDKELNNTLNDKLDLDCDISSVFDSGTKQDIYNLLKNDDLINEYFLPGKSTKDILSEAINENCGNTGKSKEDFYEALENVMVGDPIDWNTASDQEITDKLMKVLKYRSWIAHCTGKDNAKRLNITDLFTNIPQTGNWSKRIITGNCKGGKDENFKIKIDINFNQLGDDQCLWVTPPNATGIGGQSTTNPRWLASENTWAFDYVRCFLPSEYTDNIPPAMEIIVENYWKEIFEYYYVLGWGTKCPNK